MISTHKLIIYASSKWEIGSDVFYFYYQVCTIDKQFVQVVIKETADAHKRDN